MLSRDENSPGGWVVAKRVEEVFERNGLIWELRIGGRVIRSTAEHPFYRQGDGWVALNQLRVGDQLLGEDGEWLVVEGLRDTGDFEPVFNFRVADFHTYFVGEQAWGWAVWAHNANYNERIVSQTARELDSRISFIRKPGLLNEVVQLLQAGKLANAATKLQEVRYIGARRSWEIVARLQARVAAKNPSGAVSTISSQMEVKVLYGEVRGNKIVGGHSPQVGELPSRVLTTQGVNPSGTITAQLQGQIPGGGLTTVKGVPPAARHTLFPEHWTDSQIVQGILDGGNRPYTAGPRMGDGSTTHHIMRDGVMIEVIKRPNGEIIAGYALN